MRVTSSGLPHHPSASSVLHLIVQVVIVVCCEDIRRRRSCWFNTSFSQSTRRELVYPGMRYGYGPGEFPYTHSKPPCVTFMSSCLQFLVDAMDACFAAACTHICYAVSRSCPQLRLFVLPPATYQIMHSAILYTLLHSAAGLAHPILEPATHVLSCCGGVSPQYQQ